jgi:hypothetical protein
MFFQLEVGMPTVADLADRVKNISDTLLLLKSNISEGYNLIVQNGMNTSMGKDFKGEASKYDRLFQEEEAKLQASGGRTRRQTLQEFVLLFFFVAFGVLIVALALLTNVTSGMGAAVKMVGLMLLILMIVSGIIIRYA